MDFSGFRGDFRWIPHGFRPFPCRLREPLGGVLSPGGTGDCDAASEYFDYMRLASKPLLYYYISK